MPVFSTTPLYGSESWTLYFRQGGGEKKRLKAFHSLPHILGIMWGDRVPNTEVLTQAGNQSMFTLLMHGRLRWLEHVHRVADRKLPKDLTTTQLHG